MWIVFGLFVAASVVALGTARRVGRWSLAVAAVPLAVTGGWLATVLADSGAAPAVTWTWVEQLGVGLSFTIDGFAALAGLVVAGIGLLVLIYSRSYFAHAEADYVARFAGLFVAFAGAMTGLVLADDLWTLLIFWELTSVTSYLLIGLDHESESARRSALRALLVTGVGGLSMLGGIAAVAVAADTTSLAQLAGTDVDGSLLQVGLVLILVGAFTKSAQVPFHFWLPGAMEAPTPVSAFLHSATMVKAGVVIVARLAPMFTTFGWWKPLLVVVGVATMVWGAIRALSQHDAKLLLAFGTVSQLGLLMVLFGVGVPDATAAAVAMLIAHAVFKAALFMVVGVVDHATGTRDLRQLSGLGSQLPWLAGAAAVLAVSMAGVPPTLGFVAKEAALTSLLDAGAWSTVALVGVASGSALTVAYTWRWWFGLFGGDAAPVAVAHRPRPDFLAPIGLLAVVSVLGGLGAGALADRLDPIARSLDSAAHAHLALWPGVGAPLVISMSVIVLGITVAQVWPVRDGSMACSADAVYLRIMDGLGRLARRTAAVTQNGSLPSYLAVVFAVVVAVAATTVVSGPSLGDAEVNVADSPVQAIIAIGVIAAATAVCLARRRFAAVIMLGLIGYGLAALFFLYGAPDLALTQVLVETVMIVVFMLVLRRLPEDYTPPPSWAPRTLRVSIAVAVGIGMAGFALLAGSVDHERPVTNEMASRSVPEAGGYNLVNVILVDFRGFDTMGEITVLGIAALGVVNVVRSARRAEGEDVDAVQDPPSVGARSVVFDTVARIAFGAILVLSVYVTFRGHNAPGGGFAGGLIAGAAFVMRFLAVGEPRLRRSTRVAPPNLIAAGLIIAAATAVSGMIGGEALQSGIATVDVPVIGDIKVVSSALFDVGVYVLVVGAVLSVTSNLGADSSPRKAVP